MDITRGWRRGAVLAMAMVGLGWTGLGLGGGEALAGTASLGRDSASRSMVRYVAQAGERNDVRVWRVIEQVAPRYPQYAYVSDSAGIEPGPGCAAVAGTPNTVACDVTDTHGLWGFEARLGDLADSVTPLEVQSHGTRLFGGAGDDVLRGAPNATNVFVGGPGDDRMSGGGSALSVFDEGRHANGADIIEGGAGPAATAVWVDYSGRGRAVRADGSGRRDDGERGEHDTIAGAGSIVGGSGPDRLSGGRGRDVLLGGPGRDILVGGGGDDALDAEWPGRAVPPSSRRSHDRLSGGAGADGLFAGPGGNVLRGGPGADYLSGGRGADRLTTSDDAADRALCGAGGDRLVQDRLDFHQGCERHARQPAAAVAFTATAYTGKFGDRFVYVRFGCPGKVVPCVGTARLEVDGAVQREMPFRRHDFDDPGTASATFTGDVADLAAMPFGDVWALFLARSARAVVAVDTDGGDGETVRVPVSKLADDSVNLRSAYLPDEVVDHVKRSRR